MLRAMALIAAAVGAAGSVALMLHVGHRNDSSIPGILLVVFTGWVLSPFVALVVADNAPVSSPAYGRRQPQSV